MSFVAFGSLLLLVATFCSDSTAALDTRIVNGQTANPTNFRYQASIKNATVDDLLCGASVIKPRYVLTAAHCVNNLAASSIKVVVNSNGLLTGGVNHEVASVTIHALFDSNTLIYDVAVVKTTTNLLINNIVVAVPLAPSNVIVGTVGTVSGWGPTSFSSTVLSPVLKALKTRVISKTQCQSLWNNFTIQSTHVCTLTAHAGVCDKDDGDPFVTIYNIQYGMVSKFKCTDGYPVIYTNIATVYSWISTHTPP